MDRRYTDNAYQREITHPVHQATTLQYSAVVAAGRHKEHSLILIENRKFHRLPPLHRETLGARSHHQHLIQL